MLLWALLASVVVSTSALSSKEMDAVRKLSNLFPALSYLPPFANLTYSFGKAWSNDLSTLCPVGTVGWSFYGLRCDGTGHIDGLRMYAPFLDSALCFSHSDAQLGFKTLTLTIV